MALPDTVTVPFIVDLYSQGMLKFAAEVSTQYLSDNFTNYDHEAELEKATAVDDMNVEPAAAAPDQPMSISLPILDGDDVPQTLVDFYTVCGVLYASLYRLKASTQLTSSIEQRTRMMGDLVGPVIREQLKLGSDDPELIPLVNHARRLLRLAPPALLLAVAAAPMINEEYPRALQQLSIARCLLVLDESPAVAAIDGLCVAAHLATNDVRSAAIVANGMYKEDPSLHNKMMLARVALTVGDIATGERLLLDVAKGCSESGPDRLLHDACCAMVAMAKRDWPAAEKLAIQAYETFKTFPTGDAGQASETLAVSAITIIGLCCVMQGSQYRAVLMLEDAVRRHPAVFCKESVIRIIVRSYKGVFSKSRVSKLCQTLQKVVVRFGTEDFDISMFP